MQRHLLATSICLICSGVGNSALGSETPSVKLGFDVRFDAISEAGRISKQGQKTQKKNTESFTFWSSRFNLRGQIDENTSYRIRYQAQSDHTNAGADGLTGAIQYFYIDRKFGDFNLRLGKQFVVTSSWEFNIDRSKTYHYAKTFVQSPGFYETGAQVSYSFWGQTIGIQATNSLPESASKRSSDFTKGLFWYGNFEVGGLIVKPIASVVAFPKAQIEGEELLSDATTMQYSVGSRFYYGAWDFYVIGGRVYTPDYDGMASEIDKDGLPITQSRHIYSEDWRTAIAYLRYQFKDPAIHPFVKYSYDQGNIGGYHYADYKRYSAGLEWFPESDRLWFHLVYVNKRDEDRALQIAGDVVKEQKVHESERIIAGVGSNF